MNHFGDRCHTESVLQHLLHEGILCKENPCGLFIDEPVLEENMKEVKECLPEPFFHHHYAVKANPVKGVLNVVKRNGFGVECASFGEIYNALQAGMEYSDIVYDSPLKLESDLEYCFRNGIHINFDNMQELERGFSVFQQLKAKNEVKPGHIGIRINSQYGAGRIEATSTATPTSKFGVPIKDTDFEELIAWFLRWKELDGLHSHVGSQGMNLEMMAAGVRFIAELAEQINSRIGGKQIRVLDIGGGLPVDYDCDAANHIYRQYAADLRAAVPTLFSGEYVVLTEMGRSIVATAGWFASRVEYVKQAGGVLVGITHAGGNLFVREVYMRDLWHHGLTVYDAAGKEKTEDQRIASIAGPLCFSGDLIVKEKRLPAFQQGDYIIYHSTGAYSISMYSMYNCIAAPPVYLYAEEGGKVKVHCIKRKQTVEEVAKFWGEV